LTNYTYKCYKKVRGGSPMSRAVITLALVLCVISTGASLLAQDKASLRGSRASVNKAYQEAMDNDLSFLSSEKEVRRFVRLGILVKLESSRTYEVDEYVSFPYVRPEVKLFVERFSSQHLSACGEKVVVTSGTRPKNRQPPNASKRSVHPAGMSVDFRVLTSAKCRRWTENTLLTMEERGVIDATRERRPPHYHVPVFLHRYAEYVASRNGSRTHRVKRGDTLSRIAVLYKTSVKSLMKANNLSSSRIRIGQTLRIQ